ncbi:MAG TPA: hypothetical protein VG733_10945 [Chthoniobacteraceae bacterium]|nr:hypothetical protein [Chthoniobacteraceae bacterium]
MNLRKHLLCTLILAGLAFATPGCSLFHHHEKQPKSAFKIIPEGEKNPSIKETPDTVEDTPTRKVQVESGPVGFQ